MYWRAQALNCIPLALTIDIAINVKKGVKGPFSPCITKYRVGDMGSPGFVIYTLREILILLFWTAREP